MEDHDHADGFDEHKAADGIQLHLWKRLLRYALPYRKELWLLAAGGCVTALMEIALPLLAKGVVDDVQANGLDASFGFWSAAYAGCNLLLAIGGATFVWMAGKIDAFASHDIRRDAFANLQRLSFSYFDHRPVGWLMARMTADCRKLTDILGMGVPRPRLGSYDDDRHRRRDARDALATGPGRHGSDARRGLGVGEVPQANPRERASRPQYEFAHHGFLQRVDHGHADQQGVRSRRRQCA